MFHLDTYGEIGEIRKDGLRNDRCVFWLIHFEARALVQNRVGGHRCNIVVCAKTSKPFVTSQIHAPVASEVKFCTDRHEVRCRTHVLFSTEANTAINTSLQTIVTAYHSTGTVQNWSDGLKLFRIAQFKDKQLIKGYGRKLVVVLSLSVKHLWSKRIHQNFTSYDRNFEQKRFIQS